MHVSSRLFCFVLLGGVSGSSLLSADEPVVGAVGVVSGKIVDADGNAVADAQVRLRGRRLVRASTDRDGCFLFEKVQAGEYSIWARKGELACPIQRFHNVAADDPKEPRFTPVTLELKPGKAIHVSVVSEETGDPLQGAGLRLDYPFRRTVTTQADGTARFVGLTSERYRLSAELQDHARMVREIDLGNARKVTEITLKLPAGGVVRGVVEDQDGNPLPDVGVSYRTPSHHVFFYGTSPRTNERGEFRNNHLPLNAKIEMSIGKADYLSQRRELSLTPEMREVVLKIRLMRRPRGGSIAGTVKDEAGNPIAGAKVSNYGRRSTAVRTTTTDQNGRFRLDDLHKNYVGHEILVTAKGFAGIRRQVEPGTADKPTEVAAALPAGHTLRGRVVNSDGQPIPAAYISYNGAGYPGRLGGSSRTNDQGLFEFDSMPELCKFDVRAKGFSSISGARFELDGKEPVVVTMEAAGVLEGRVFDYQTGEPVKDFIVQLGFSEDQRPGDARGSYNATLGEPGLNVASKTGRFKIPELVHRMPFEVTIVADGYEKLVLPRVVASNKRHEPLRKIALKKLDPSKLFTLRGQILDFQGRPAADAQLRLIVTSRPVPPGDNSFNWILIESGQIARRGRCEQFLSLVSDSKGRFEFKGILSGKYVHLAMWGQNVPRGRHYVADVTKPGVAQDIKIELPEPAAIVGTIDMAPYRDASQILLSNIAEPWHRYEFKLTDDTKEFRFPVLPPGAYQVFVQSKPERTSETGYTLRPLARRRLTLSPGETREIRFDADDRLKPQ